ncbi:uncharacterized protein EDB91DRAFT_1042130 [Suillus paluster]|uniref:uncharacterized protein n=1 Tax=Suillus paluster TaxID=48578 RepID=UPI001B86360B|nr:uncharacterized protein EDB91DRAFT_1042130 [Suillus paluster]KAG1754959.1 hypothetical protein EDB91DRAFT_1042130 [Suillus paluster]
MSLKDIGKYDVSEEAQALKDKLASQDTENAGLRSRLMKREAELHEIKTSLNETLYKLSAEADRALKLESDLACRSDELKIEKVTSRNAEIALVAAQDRLKAEERAARQLEATLDTMSCQSDSVRAQTLKLEAEKRTMESRVRELERMLQNMEMQPAANSRLPQRGGRPRSSSVAGFRSPALERELNDTKALLAEKEKSLRDIEMKLARAQEDLVKSQNTQFSAEKTMQARIAELAAIIEDKDEELEVTRGSTMEREEELLKRIDEDEAKIETLESLLRAQQTGPTQAAYDKLQRRLRAESDKLTCSEKRVRDLMEEKNVAQDACATIRQELDRAERLFQDSENRVKALKVIERCVVLSYQPSISLNFEPVDCNKSLWISGAIWSRRPLTRIIWISMLKTSDLTSTAASYPQIALPRCHRPRPTVLLTLMKRRSPITLKHCSGL